MHITVAMNTTISQDIFLLPPAITYTNILTHWAAGVLGPECLSSVTVERCPSPHPAWVFSARSILGGACLRWDPNSQCLDPGENAFATLLECWRVCRNGTSTRCGPPRSRTCRDDDRRIEYVVNAVPSSAPTTNESGGPQLRCSRIPPDMCTGDGRGFKSLQACRDTCFATPADTTALNDSLVVTVVDERCREAVTVRRCSWSQRRLPFYFDPEESRLPSLPATLSGQGGFPTGKHRFTTRTALTPGHRQAELELASAPPSRPRLFLLRRGALAGPLRELRHSATMASGWSRLHAASAADLLLPLLLVLLAALATEPVEGAARFELRLRRFSTDGTDAKGECCGGLCPGACHVFMRSCLARTRDGGPPACPFGLLVSPVVANNSMPEGFALAHNFTFTLPWPGRFKLTVEAWHTQNGAVPPEGDRRLLIAETFRLLLALKVRYPTRITLIGGNHRSQHITPVVGFHDECFSNNRTHAGCRYCTDVFDFLPLSDLVDGHADLLPPI
ncbi:hypothetical protein HPB48_017157 [Haemaphysalis longicornis]|uniref:Notch ligand N-terminal domain-containing protein n=1 Tax=Haemaphysalis longicornis TaxID=44386 RepID=A0A9J6GKQ8_HAELO|nr:hypothetical protein HPB48_017157 [Haemaphysalis longicornis]